MTVKQQEPLMSMTLPPALETPIMSKTAMGLFTGVIGSVTNRTLLFVFQIIISRMYGPEDYGLFVTGMLTCHFVQEVASLGLQKGGMKFLAGAHARGDAEGMTGIFWSAVIIALCSGIICGMGFHWVAPHLASVWSRNPALGAVLQIFSFSIPFFVMLRVCSELSRAFMTAKYAVMVEDCLFPLLHICFFILLHYYDYGFHSAVYAFVCSSACCSILMFIVVLTLLKGFRKVASLPPALIGRVHPPREDNSRKALLLFSLLLLPHGVLFCVRGFTDFIMLNFLATPADIGRYAAALRWMQVFSLVAYPMIQILGPMVAGQHGLNDAIRIRLLYLTTSRWMLCLMIPLFTFLFVARGPLMLIFGEEFASSGPTVLAILLIGNFSTAVVGLAGYTMAMSGHHNFELACSAGCVLLNILLNLLLVPIFGVIGAAIATTVSFIAADGMRLLIVFRRYGMQPFSASLLFPALISLFICILHLLIAQIGDLSALINVTAALCGALLVLYVSWQRGLSSDDRALLTTLIKRLCAICLGSISC